VPTGANRQHGLLPAAICRDGLTTRFAIPGHRWRLYGHRQLSPAGAAQAGEEPRTAEADLLSDPAHDSDAGAEEGNGKDVQGLLRHSRAAITTDVYMQEIPESVQATVNAINPELRVKAEEIQAD
jgi:hypothetical protein